MVMRDMSDMGDLSRVNSTFYYVGAIYNNEPVVLGRFYTEEQARQEAARKLNCPFQVYELDTADMRKATKIVKYRLLNGSNMNDIMKRAHHQIDEPPDTIDEI